MKNSLTRKGLAFASTVALALAGLAATTAPANSANYSDVDDVVAVFTEDTSLYTSGSDATIKAGVKTKSMTVQLVDVADEDVALSGVRVRAFFELGVGGLEDADGKFTVGSDSEDIDEAGGNITVLGTTNSSGAVTLSFTNTGADDGDQIDYTVEYYSEAGWIFGGTSGSGSIDWEDAAAESLDADRNIASQADANVTINYTVVDQFGGPISRQDGEDFEVSISTNAEDFSVNDLFEDGVVTTKDVVAGKASFTFKNVADVGNYMEIYAALHFDSEDVTDDEDADIIQSWSLSEDVESYTDVHANGVTSEVETDQDFYETVVSYGWGEDEDWAYVDIEVNGVDPEDEDVTAGQAYQDVTISSSSAGIAFAVYDEDGEWVHTPGSITTKTDEDGNSEVYVYSKFENTDADGVKIKITSGGESKTVNLATFMNTSDIDEDGNSKLTWNWLKVTGGLTDGAPASNTAYTVRVTAADKWGNRLDGADVFVEGANSEDMAMIDPFEDGSLKIWGLTDGEDNNQGTETTNANGVGFFNVKATNIQYPKQKAYYYFEAYLDEWTYGEVTVNFLGDGSQFKSAEGWTGAQAQAKAGAKKGAVRVGAYNVTGQTVKVYVGGKLVKTATAGKAKYVTRVTGIKAGDKRVTVWVGKKRLLSTTVTVK